jgi:tetraacyldisaccharide 4'-kinase
MKAINWPAIHAARQGNVMTISLKIISLLYGAAIQLRLIAYKIGLLPVKSIPAYVVSVGNVTTGGTGKTPLIAMLAEWAGKSGYRVGILSRGYKGKRSHNSLVVSDGKRTLASADEAGDEPFLLAKKLPSVPVLISKKRYRIGHLALKLFGSQLLLLDDGYQHLSLHRDLNILLLDAKRQFGNKQLLPLGPLREPIEQIKRADVIIITRCTTEHPGDDLIAFLQRSFSGLPILRSGHFPDQVIFPLVPEVHPPCILSGRRVVVFAGLANPDEFLEMVKGLGARIVHFQAFPDHHRFTEDEIEELATWKRRSSSNLLLTTEKDWVRIDGRITVDLDIGILTIKVGILSEGGTLFEMIRQGILTCGANLNESQVQT